MPLFLFFNTETMHIKSKAQNSIVMYVVHVQYITGTTSIHLMTFHLKMFHLMTAFHLKRRFT
jgi:hypothetical protein